MKTIGVLGGMGPEATAHFLRLIVVNTAAASDQEHVPVAVWSDPRVPDRTAAIVEGGESPLPRLVDGAAALRRAGADFLVIPCVTAHYFIAELASRCGLPILNLLEETAAVLRTGHPDVKTLGLLASTGTVSSRIVPRALEGDGIDVLIPDADGQGRIMEAIYGPDGIKAGRTTGRPARLVEAEAAALVARGAQAILAGCTEIPLALREDRLPVPLIEPMRIGARSAVLRAGGRLTQKPRS